MKFPFSFWGNSAGTVIAKRSVATDPHASIKVATASTVDWGDGQPLMPVAANTQVNYTYTGTLGDVTVTITAMTPAPMNPDLSLKHPASTAADAGWKEVIIHDPHMTNFTVKPNASLRTLRVKGKNDYTLLAPNPFESMFDLEEIEIYGFAKLAASYRTICSNNKGLKRFILHTPAALGSDTFLAFQFCAALETIQWDFSLASSMVQMFKDAKISWEPNYHLPEARLIGGLFQNTKGFTSINVTGTSKVTGASGFATGSSVQTINRMDLSACTDTSGMFSGALHMVHHPGYIGELSQNTSYMFNNCPLLETIGDIGMEHVTNTNLMLATCPKLRSFTLRGLKVSVAINGLKLDATALDAVFTSLGTANAGATINITGNPGAATCNKTIATSKSWAVTG